MGSSAVSARVLRAGVHPRLDGPRGRRFVPLALMGSISVLIALAPFAPAASPATLTAPFHGDRALVSVSRPGPGALGCHAVLGVPVPGAMNATTGAGAVWLRGVAQWCGGGPANDSFALGDATLGLEGFAFKAPGSTIRVAADWTISFRAKDSIFPANGTGFAEVTAVVETRLVDTTTGAWVFATNYSAGTAQLCDIYAYSGVPLNSASALSGAFSTNASYAVVPGTVYLVWAVLEITVDAASFGVGDWAFAEFNVGSSGLGADITSLSEP